MILQAAEAEKIAREAQEKAWKEEKELRSYDKLNDPTQMTAAGTRDASVVTFQEHSSETNTILEKISHLRTPCHVRNCFWWLFFSRKLLPASFDVN